MLRFVVCLALVAGCMGFKAVADTVPTEGHFVNFETPHVSPIALSPDGTTLAVCNTPDNRVEIYVLLTGTPEHIMSVPVGMDPVSVRFYSNTELWVVNHVSDSVSVVDLLTGGVVATLQTLDEPTDVVFAGEPLKAFVSCAQVSKIMVFDPVSLGGPIHVVNIAGKEPRAMAVSADGSQVYCAIFESGNRSTLLGGGSGDANVLSFPPNVVNDTGTPHSGINPPFNDNGAFYPPLWEPEEGENIPPKVGLIVKQNESGQWLDDTGANWTSWVSGANANKSGRPLFWKLVDNDLAVINANTFAVNYVEHMMNICMALAVNPASGAVSVVGTDAINEMRFEPNVNGIFAQVMLASTDSNVAQTAMIRDLNDGHLDYSVRTLPQSERQKSIGDPRGIVWDDSGTTAYITGMGSNNIIVVDTSGERVGLNPTIEVQEGPTGLVYDGARGNLYVLNKFGASLSVVDLATETETAVIPFHDPTPDAIRVGRKHLYDTHRNSGLGHVSCATCHVDARTDMLAWDLGAPDEETVPHTDALLNLNKNAGIPLLNALGDNFSNLHAMKGPMTTQTLQDIIGHEPLHWRGDRFGIEHFNGAFIGLQGNNTNLNATEMQEFKDFLATLHFPPNPYRNLDNTLSTSVDLEGHFNPGRFGGQGQPLGSGNAVAGLSLYRNTSRNLDRGVVSCIACHALPSGSGTPKRWDTGLGRFVDIPPGHKDQNHLMMVSVDGSTQRIFKVAHLRNMYKKVGAEFTPGNPSLAGFGYGHDGSVDSLARFVSQEAFFVQSTQEIANLVALMISWTGSDFGVPNDGTIMLEPPGQMSKDAHAAVGQQVTIRTPADNRDDLDALLAIVNGSPRVEMIAKGIVNGVMRGWLHTGSNSFQADQQGVVHTLPHIINHSAPGREVTFTVVPAGSGVRMGIDRDLDGHYDYDEFLCGTDPADPADVPDGDCAGGGDPPQNKGAACFPDGACFEMTKAFSDAFGGAYQGDGTTCALAACPQPEAENPYTTHSADINANNRIEFTELLRIIQLYNMGEFHCQVGTEDGYHPGAGPRSCAPHASDYDPQDWSISLMELLRLVQIYNLGGYYHCPSGTTEDGYCPVPVL